MGIELEKTEVTVAPGQSMREPIKVHMTKVRSPSGAPEDRVVDVELRAVMPGEKLFVFTKDVPALIAMGAILDPATGLAHTPGGRRAFPPVMDVTPKTGA